VVPTATAVLWGVGAAPLLDTWAWVRVRVTPRGAWTAGKHLGHEEHLKRVFHS
jgi:hypothetical protein